MAFLNNNCCPDMPIQLDKWIGCDGKPVSNEILQSWLKIAIDKERYEYAAEIRDELINRNKQQTQQ